MLMVTEPNVTLKWHGKVIVVFLLRFLQLQSVVDIHDKFQFDQQHMRTQLTWCLEKWQFTIFPIKKNIDRQKKYDSEAYVEYHRSQRHQ
jgi:hypothetical protein